MRKLILRRLMISVALVVLVSMLTFVLEALAPGDTARTILGYGYTPRAYARLRVELGLNQQLTTQYWDWLKHAIRGDLGVSPISGLSVGTQVIHRLGVTLSLIVGTTLIATILGLALGIVSAIRGGFFGRTVDVVSLLGFAMPSFWFGLVLIEIFAVKVRWLPTTGYIPFGVSVEGWARSLVLPVIALAVPAAALIAKQTRDGMLDALGRDFVQSLRANGASESSIIFRHALRNAAIPVVTVIGLTFVGLLNGTVLVETVFALPGLGGLAVQSTTDHDLPVVQGVVVTFAVIVVVVNLIVDLAYGWLNPKVRVR